MQRQWPTLDYELYAEHEDIRDLLGDGQEAFQGNEDFVKSLSWLESPESSPQKPASFSAGNAALKQMDEEYSEYRDFFSSLMPEQTQLAPSQNEACPELADSSLGTLAQPTDLTLPKTYPSLIPSDSVYTEAGYYPVKAELTQTQTAYPQSHFDEQLEQVQASDKVLNQQEQAKNELLPSFSAYETGMFPIAVIYLPLKKPLDELKRIKTQCAQLRTAQPYFDDIAFFNSPEMVENKKNELLHKTQEVIVLLKRALPSGLSLAFCLRQLNINMRVNPLSENEAYHYFNLMSQVQDNNPLLFPSYLSYSLIPEVNDRLIIYSHFDLLISKIRAKMYRAKDKFKALEKFQYSTKKHGVLLSLKERIDEPQKFIISTMKEYGIREVLLAPVHQDNQQKAEHGHHYANLQLVQSQNQNGLAHVFLSADSRWVLSATKTKELLDFSKKPQILDKETRRIISLVQKGKWEYGAKARGKQNIILTLPQGSKKYKRKTIRKYINPLSCDPLNFRIAKDSPKKGSYTLKFVLSDQENTKIIGNQDLIALILARIKSNIRETHDVEKTISTRANTSQQLVSEISKVQSAEVSANVDEHIVSEQSMMAGGANTYFVPDPILSDEAENLFVDHVAETIDQSQLSKGYVRVLEQDAFPEEHRDSYNIHLSQYNQDFSYVPEEADHDLLDSPLFSDEEDINQFINDFASMSIASSDYYSEPPIASFPLYTPLNLLQRINSFDAAENRANAASGAFMGSAPTEEEIINSNHDLFVATETEQEINIELNKPPQLNACFSDDEHCQTLVEVTESVKQRNQASEPTDELECDEGTEDEFEIAAEKQDVLVQQESLENESSSSFSAYEAGLFPIAVIYFPPKINVNVALQQIRSERATLKINQAHFADLIFFNHPQAVEKNRTQEVVVLLKRALPLDLSLASCLRELAIKESAYPLSANEARNYFNRLTNIKSNPYLYPFYLSYSFLPQQNDCFIIYSLFSLKPRQLMGRIERDRLKFNKFKNFSMQRTTHALFFKLKEKVDEPKNYIMSFMKEYGIREVLLAPVHQDNQYTEDIQLGQSQILSGLSYVFLTADSRWILSAAMTRKLLDFCKEKRPKIATIEKNVSILLKGEWEYRAKLNNQVEIVYTAPEKCKNFQSRTLRRYMNPVSCDQLDFKILKDSPKIGSDTIKFNLSNKNNAAVIGDRDLIELLKERIAININDALYLKAHNDSESNKQAETLSSTIEPSLSIPLPQRSRSINLPLSHDELPRASTSDLYADESLDPYEDDVFPAISASVSDESNFSEITDETHLEPLRLSHTPTAHLSSGSLKRKTPDDPHQPTQGRCTFKFAKYASFFAPRFNQQQLQVPEMQKETRPIYTTWSSKFRPQTQEINRLEQQNSESEKKNSIT